MLLKEINGSLFSTKPKQHATITHIMVRNKIRIILIWFVTIKIKRNIKKYSLPSYCVKE